MRLPAIHMALTVGSWVIFSLTMFERATDEPTEDDELTVLSNTSTDVELSGDPVDELTPHLSPSETEHAPAQANKPFRYGFRA